MNYVLEVGSKKMVLEKKGKDRNKGFLRKQRQQHRKCPFCFQEVKRTQQKQEK